MRQEQVFEECVQNRVPEQIMDSPVPQLMEAVVEVIPQERVQNRTLKQIVGVPVPQLMEAVVEVTPQERVQNRKGVIVYTSGLKVHPRTQGCCSRQAELQAAFDRHTPHLLAFGSCCLLSRRMWIRKSFASSFYVGDAGNTSLVDAGTPLGATAVVTPGSAGYLLWECCILASL